MDLSYQGEGVRDTLKPFKNDSSMKVIFTFKFRYRKFHLYFENQFNVPELEQSTFKTDFGVEFGIFTCFDIIFAHPAVQLVASEGIRNFIFPTAWVDELPFLTAIQAQSLWAQSNKVNLLASGYHNPERGSMGSGIFSGFHNSYLNYTFDPASGTKLIVSRVPIGSESQSQAEVQECSYDSVHISKSENAPNEIQSDHFWLREDLRNYSHKVINPTLNSDSLCHLNLFCCNISYDLIPPENGLGSGRFKLFVFEGRRTVAAKTDWFDWQVCAVVHCLNDTLESCTEVDPDQYYASFDRAANHPKFRVLNIQAHPVKVNFEGKAALAGLSLLDTQFNLIPQNMFDLIEWNDLENGVRFAEAKTRNELRLDKINIKTVALIQKIYGDRL